MKSKKGISKRQNGCFFTKGNPFLLDPFQEWMGQIDMKGEDVLEPFAGANDIIHHLPNLKFISYDIHPRHENVMQRDTIKHFPVGYEVAITNPPWLAKNSAKRRGLSFPNTMHDDIYKHCLELCLYHCNYVAMLVPATFLQSNLYRDRLETFILLHDKNIFTDTDNPVALALFSPHIKRTKIYYDNQFIGDLEVLEKHLPHTMHCHMIRFNDPYGELGFIAFDNTIKPTIRFCRGSELATYKIKPTTRMITRIDIGMKVMSDMIALLNQSICHFRDQTYDVFLTPFKGIRKDGMYRRRMDYVLARGFISNHISKHISKHVESGFLL